jgi:hypothetical protein
MVNRDGAFERPHAMRLVQAIECFSRAIRLDGSQSHVYGNRSVAFLR